jgi:hypothetical protein
MRIAVTQKRPHLIHQPGEDTEKKVTQVAAEDGNTYEFGEKAKVKKLSSLEGSTAVIKFVFRNGAVRSTQFAPDHALFARLAQHGADQKIGDEFAGLDDPEDCVAAFEGIAARLQAGEWSEKRASEGLAGTSMLARALAEVTGKPLAEVKERLAKTPKEQKAAIGKQKAVAAVIERLKAERDAKKGTAVDADAALEAFVG